MSQTADEAEMNALPPRRRRRGLSIAIWVPALVGLALVLVLTAFTSLGVAAPGQAGNGPANEIVLL